MAEASKHGLADKPYDDDDDVDELMADDEFMVDDDDDYDDYYEYSDAELDADDDNIDDGYQSDDNFERVIADKPARKVHQVPFLVKSASALRCDAGEMIRQVAGILGLSVGKASILCQHAQWDRERLLERYMDNSANTLERAGVDPAAPDVSPVEILKAFECFICCEKGDLATFALSCGHRYCVSCYRTYLTGKIKADGEMRVLRCPGDSCGLSLTPEAVKLLVEPSVFERYLELVDQSYVEYSERLKWCPAPDCGDCVECGVTQSQLATIVPTVACSCGKMFCFGCQDDDHQPCPCSLVKMWKKKCRDDSETANWISANTKECPKCFATIEKNGGCNHMTCKKCRHEFCWVCIGPWNIHGTSYFNCNRYDEQKGLHARDEQTKSRMSLERYLHYYNRYANHEQSARLDRELYNRVEKKMTQMQVTSDMSWVEVQFLKNAVDTLVQCRHTLKWTYAFAFYLKRENMTEIFEDIQRDLELAVENLSELCEKPIERHTIASLKQIILDRTVYVRSRWNIVLEDTAAGLQDGRWSFNIDL